MNDYCNEPTREGMPSRSRYGKTRVARPAATPWIINTAVASKRIAPGPSIMSLRAFRRVSAGDAMIGLSRSDATDGMISLNLRNLGRRKERISLSALGFNACEIAADRS